VPGAFAPPCIYTHYKLLTTCARFEVLTAVFLESQVFWDVNLCRWVTPTFRSIVVPLSNFQHIVTSCSLILPQLRLNINMYTENVFIVVSGSPSSCRHQWTAMTQQAALPLAFMCAYALRWVASAISKQWLVWQAVHLCPQEAKNYNNVRQVLPSLPTPRSG
jgi:hypothetical protein